MNDLLTMNVETQLGPVELTVKRGPHWAHDVPDGKLFVDVDEDQYVLPSDRRLTEREQELLRRYADG